jgi:phytanoyl-CoA hydroxylase
MMLSQQYVDDYRNKGFTCVQECISPTSLSALRDEVDAITGRSSVASHDAERVEMEPGQTPEGNKIRRIYEPCEYYACFRDFAESTEILDAVEQLVGADILLHYSKLNMKPAELGSVVEWHQDLSFYPLTNPDSLAVLIYLDDADEQNGCLKVLPGRHREPLMDHTAGGVFQGCIEGEVNEAGVENMVGKAGTVTFMNGMTPHASAQNLGSKPRRTLIVSYRAADAMPIHLGNRTAGTEEFTRLVRGQPAREARFGFDRFPIPVYGAKEASLYELQAQSRRSLRLGLIDHNQ